MPSYLGADDARLHYDVLGEGHERTLVLLAGGAGRHPAYLGDLAGLSEHWRLVVPHLRGVGRSPRPDDADSGAAWRQADDVERLRAHLGLEDLLLVGHSAGTRLAVAYAAQHPARVAGLLLATPPAQGLVDVPSEAEAAIARRGVDPELAAALDALAAGPDTSSDATFNAWHLRAAPAGYAQWGTAERAHAGAGGFTVAAALAYFTVPPPQDLGARLAGLTSPVLVVGGAEDLFTDVGTVKALAGVFTGARSVVLDACGHYPWVERPAAFRAAVDPFLADVAARPRQEGSR